MAKNKKFRYQTSGRKAVTAYAERVLGLKNLSMMCPAQLLIAVGLWPPTKAISRNSAKETLSSITEYDLVVKAPRPEHWQRRATPIQKKARRPDGFYVSRRWLELRYVVLQKSGGKCACCGARGGDGVRLDVDHIKPKSIYPELALVESNLQVLCQQCNVGKSNKDETDWRAAEEFSDAAIGRILRSITYSES